MEKKKINMKQISMRARTKKEIFWIPQLGADIYLPPIAQANRIYIAGVLSGKVKVRRILSATHIAFEKLPTQKYSGSTFGRPQS